MEGECGPSPFLLLLLPMAIDGGTHFLSDFSGLGRGFRDTNLWLAGLTGGSLPAGFYAGDAWGSFNTTMRLASGILFGLGVAWFAVPRIEASFHAAAKAKAANRRRAAARVALRSGPEPVCNSGVDGVQSASKLPDPARPAGAGPRDGGD